MHPAFAKSLTKLNTPEPKCRKCKEIKREFDLLRQPTLEVEQEQFNPLTIKLNALFPT